MSLIWKRNCKKYFIIKLYFNMNCISYNLVIFQCGWKKIHNFSSEIQNHYELILKYWYKISGLKLDVCGLSLQDTAVPMLPKCQCLAVPESIHPDARPAQLDQPAPTLRVCRYPVLKVGCVHTIQLNTANQISQGPKNNCTQSGFPDERCDPNFRSIKSLYWNAFSEYLLRMVSQ